MKRGEIYYIENDNSVGSEQIFTIDKQEYCKKRRMYK